MILNKPSTVSQGISRRINRGPLEAHGLPLDSHGGCRGVLQQLAISSTSFAAAVGVQVRGADGQAALALIRSCLETSKRNALFRQAWLLLPNRASKGMASVSRAVSDVEVAAATGHADRARHEKDAVSRPGGSIPNRSATIAPPAPVLDLCEGMAPERTPDQRPLAPAHLLKHRIELEIAVFDGRGENGASQRQRHDAQTARTWSRPYSSCIAAKPGQCRSDQETDAEKGRKRSRTWIRAVGLRLQRHRG